MEKEKNVKNDCIYIKRLKYLAKWRVIVGIVIIAGGFFMYFCPKHLCYNQPLALIIMIGLGLFCIIMGILSFIRIRNLCK